MLPDFPIAKDLVTQKLFEFFEERIKFYSSGLLVDMPTRALPEGNSFATQYDEILTDNSGFRKISSSLTFSNEEIKNNPELIFDKLDKLAKDFANQQSALVIDRISEVSEKVGNTLTYKDLSPEDIFKMYEKIQIDFDSNGKARLPSIICNEKMRKDFVEVLDQIDNDPGLSKRFNDILNKQKQNWYDREAGRKLVG